MKKDKFNVQTTSDNDEREKERKKKKKNTNLAYTIWRCASIREEFLNNKNGEWKADTKNI